MAVCQKCGKESPPQAAVCTYCGTQLAGAKKANLAGTMLGMPSPLVPGVAPAAPSEKPADLRTIPAPAEAANRRNLAGTVIGMPSPLSPGAGQTQAESPAPGGPAGSSGKSAALNQTMVGMGAPVVMAPGAAHVPHAPRSQSNPGPPEGLKDAPMPQTRKFQGTLLGVALPGIAPSLANAKAPPRANPALAAGAPPVSEEPRVSSWPVEQQFPTTRPAWKTILMIAGAMGAAAALGGAFALLSPKPVTVVVEEFAIDVDGNDQLKIKCDECPEGSELVLGEARAPVEEKRAVLTPAAPLALGRNELEFHLKMNGELRDVKKVILPIAFRVLTNWTGLHESPPHAEISVAAPSDSKVTIGGKETPLEAQKAVRRITFEEETLGESAKVARVHSEYNVIVTFDGKTRETKAELQSAITPLTLTSPGSLHQLGGKPVAISGRTAAGAKVTIGKVELEADDKGLFTHVLEAPEPGTVVVTASAEKFLSRRVEIELSESVPVPENAVTAFSDIVPGASVDLSASVIESRTAGGTTQVLVEVEKGCKAPPCLLRAVYGEPKKLSPNRIVRLTGTVAAGSPLTVKVSRFR